MLSNFQYDIIKRVDQNPFIRVEDLSNKVHCKECKRFKNAVQELLHQEILIITPEQDLDAYWNSYDITSKYKPMYETCFHLFLSEHSHAVNDEHTDILKKGFWTRVIAWISLICSIGSLILQIRP